MQGLKRWWLTAITAAALTIAACSKSVEGESHRWETYSTRATELAALYPGFKPAIEARKASATQIHEAAASLGEKEKIEKLSEANKALMAGFMGDLDDIDAKMKSLREKRVEAAAQTSEATRLGAQVAAEDAQKALERVEALLKAGAPDEAAAAAVLKKATADLRTAEAALDKVLKADKAKRDAADEGKKAAEATKAKEEADAAAKVAPWKCAYCNSENPHDETSCKSCGAPRASEEKDKAAKPAP